MGAVQLGPKVRWHSASRVGRNLESLGVRQTEAGQPRRVWRRFKPSRAVLFSGSGYEEVYIQYPLFQTYASLPVGMFVPVVFWILVFVQSQKTKPRNSRVTSTKSAYFCGSCGKIISSEYVFCPFCGKENRKVACESCGTSISAWSVYCPHCGTRIQREPEKSLVL